MRKIKKFLMPLALFLLGFLIMLYPYISQWYYRIDANNTIGRYESVVDELKQEEINKKFELAQAYNNTLDPSRLADPWTDKEEEGVAEYARMLEVHEQIGYIEIPKISQSIPIYAGTAESVLQKGAGHLEGTSLPVGGPSTHTVITAHRGLPTARLFTDLDKIEKEDIFYIHVLDRVLAYKVDQIKVIEPTNFEDVFVVDDMDYATLLTCTPYMINSHRLLVRGHRVDYVAPVKEDDLANIIPDFTYRDYLPFALIILLVLLAIAVYYFIDYRKVKKKVEDISNEKKN